MVRQGVKELGLTLLADESCASDTVTAVRVPEDVDGKALVDTLRRDHGVVVAGGLGKLEGKIFRIGHLGAVDEADIRGFLKALRETIPALGFKVPA